MLVTMAMIIALATLVVPCWGMIARSRSKQVASGMIMESLDRARQVAITSKTDVWVVFQHPEGIKADCLRLLSKQGSVITPLDRWQTLPEGIVFQSGENLMKEQPPADLLSSALNGQNTAAGTHFGSIMFQRSGRIGAPLPGGNPLSVQLTSVTTPFCATISLSRATGRATCQ